MATKSQKRKDKDRIVLKAGESQRPNGTYDYRWTGPDGKRHAVYAKTLEELREKESQIQNDSFSGLKAEARCVTVNEMFDLWCQIKRGLKDNTFENYKYMYNLFVRPNFGKKRIYDLKKSEVKRFYNHLVDERNVQASTVDTIHTVLHQVLQMAVDDRYIANNPSDGVLKELKQSHIFKTEKRRGLTKPEQELLLTYLSTHPTYNHWYPIFAVLIGTGMRIGEICGLRWCDVDTVEGVIKVRHTLQRIYIIEGETRHTELLLDTPKTANSVRDIPMSSELLKMLKSLNKVVNENYYVISNDIKPIEPRTYRNYYKKLCKQLDIPELKFHGLRHSFATRCIESKADYKTVSVLLGHSNISTTLNLYVHPNKEQKKKTIDKMLRSL